MDISSRTPDGVPNRCPVCQKAVRMAPSDPAGDAPCPHCGTLLWFVVGDAGVTFFDKQRFRLTPVQSGTTSQPSIGDRVRISGGTFDNFEGTVRQIDRELGRATIVINIFGRDTPLELELWQMQPA